MKLNIIKNLPKDWVRLTILKAESLNYNLDSVRGTYPLYNDLNRSYSLKRY